MKLKFVGKYMRLAKLVGEDNNPCHSRKIGVIIVDPVSNRILGTGYNGPPKGTPHCDTQEYIHDVFWPQLDPVEKAKAANAAECTSHEDLDMCRAVCDKYANSKTCPRKIIGAPSGKRLELCSCVHGEANAIVNSAKDLYGATMFCWCGVPCVECTKLIINAGIKQVYCIDWGADYSPSSRYLFRQAGVVVECHAPDYYLVD
jgi:dCMP deaminase